MSVIQFIIFIGFWHIINQSDTTPQQLFRGRESFDLMHSSLSFLKVYIFQLFVSILFQLV